MGKGAGTISTAEVSRPLSQSGQVLFFGCCDPIPRPPWPGFVACKPHFSFISTQKQRPFRVAVPYSVPPAGGEEGFGVAVEDGVGLLLRESEATHKGDLGGGV